MDQDNLNNPINPTNPTPSTPSGQNTGSMGPLIGSIVVIIILVIGAIYFWGNKLAPKEPVEQPAAALSTSDDALSIEADLENTPEVNIDTNF